MSSQTDEWLKVNRTSYLHFCLKAAIKLSFACPSTQHLLGTKKADFTLHCGQLLRNRQPELDSVDKSNPYSEFSSHSLATFYLLYHVRPVIFHFPPGWDALYTEWVIAIRQDSKNIVSWVTLFIHVVHADSTGHILTPVGNIHSSHFLQGTWGGGGSSTGTILSCCLNTEILQSLCHLSSSWVNPL